MIGIAGIGVFQIYYVSASKNKIISDLGVCAYLVVFLVLFFVGATII